MKILNAVIAKTPPFRTLIESLKEIYTEVPIEFLCNKSKNEEQNAKAGMRILSINQAKVIVVYVLLEASKFDDYECHSNITLGINVGDFYTYIKSLEKEDTLTLSYDDEDPHHLSIDKENERSVAHLKLKLLDLDKEDIQLPDITFNSIITIPSSDFQKHCRLMNSIAEYMIIKCVGKQITFSCRCQSGTYDIIFRETEAKDEKEKKVPDKKSKEIQKITHGVYELKHLVTFTKCTSLCPNIEIYMQNDFPIVIRYSVAALGNVYFYLTPLSPENITNDDLSDIEDEPGTVKEHTTVVKPIKKNVEQKDTTTDEDAEVSTEIKPIINKKVAKPEIKKPIVPKEDKKEVKKPIKKEKVQEEPLEDEEEPGSEVKPVISKKVIKKPSKEEVKKVLKKTK